MTPEQKALRARMGGFANVAKHGAEATVAPAQRGYWAKFERMVDPENKLTPEDRKARTEAAMKQHMAKMRMARAAAAARRKKAS